MPVITINLEQRHLDELALIEQEIRSADAVTSNVSLRSALIRTAVDQYIANRKAKKKAMTKETMTKETMTNDHE